MSRLVIVTGAHGAIGQHVVRQLAQEGARVLGLGHGAHDPSIETVDWISGAIDAANLTALATKWGAPDAVIHLAGGAAVGPSLVAPAEDFDRTTATGVRLLEWTRVFAPAAALVFASSAAVYGATHKGLIPETAPRTPCSPYGFHKAMLEMAAESWGASFGLKVSIVRLFSVYGPLLRKQLVFEQASKLLRGEQSLLLGGTGQETRDWLYIGDAARYLIDAIALADASAPVFNGGAGIRTTIADTVRKLVDAAKKNAEVGFSGVTRRGDPEHLVGDVGKAQRAGLTPRISLEAGLLETVRWVEQERERMTW
jgi:UDP-glucose 4-epimerase